MRFHNFSAYKAYATSFLIKKLNEVQDEKTKILLNELINRLEILRTRDLHRYLLRLFEIQKQTGLDLSQIIPSPEEVQAILQYPA
jgi:hypothetical protein